jgi:hypothetical protein
MGTPRIVYFLIALLLSAQFDDAWISAPILSSPVAVEEDEYPPSEWRQHSEQSAPRHKLAHGGLRLQTVAIFNKRRSPASGSDLALALDRSQLYVFMSLQC